MEKIYIYKMLSQFETNASENTIWGGKFAKSVDIRIGLNILYRLDIFVDKMLLCRENEYCLPTLSEWVKITEVIEKVNQK